MPCSLFGHMRVGRSGAKAPPSLKTAEAKGSQEPYVFQGQTFMFSSRLLGNTSVEADLFAIEPKSMPRRLFGHYCLRRRACRGAPPRTLRWRTGRCSHALCDLRRQGCLRHTLPRHSRSSRSAPPAPTKLRASKNCLLFHTPCFCEGRATGHLPWPRLSPDLAGVHATFTGSRGRRPSSICRSA